MLHTTALAARKAAVFQGGGGEDGDLGQCIGATNLVAGVHAAQRAASGLRISSSTVSRAHVIGILINSSGRTRRDTSMRAICSTDTQLHRLERVSTLVHDHGVRVLSCCDHSLALLA